MALTTVRQTASSMRVSVHTKIVVISKIQMYMICDVLVLLRKAEVHFTCTDRSRITSWKTHSWFIDIFCPSVRELLTSKCHHISTNTCSNYMQKSYLSRPLYETYIIFCLSKPSNETCIIFFLSWPIFSSAVSVLPVVNVPSHTVHKGIYFKTLIWKKKHRFSCKMQLIEPTKIKYWQI